MPQSQGHTYGKFESVKFNHRRDDFYRYVDYLKHRNVPPEDFVYNFTAYIGHMTLNRCLTIYELYKKVLGVAGHVADVGVDIVSWIRLVSGDGGRREGFQADVQRRI